MLTRHLMEATTLLIVLLCGGCQQGSSPSVAEASSTPAPATPIEAATPLTGEPAVPVPQGIAPSLDGTLAAGEWDQAAVETFSDGSELLLMASDGTLYLGIRAGTPEMIVGNVFVARGDEVAILHSSAALGTALYAKGADRWQQTQGFVWRCRRTDDSAAAQAERDAFLQEERWLAANARRGTPNELEYQIEVSGDGLRLAVSFLRASNPEVKIPWPTGLDDDCVRPTPGGLPMELDFSPDRWASLAMPSLE